ncbi:MAG: hypothetical protein ACXV5L_01795 [Thermoanaerobaculia bacterium]
MFNYAGPEFDFSSVVYAVLMDCEYRRRALEPEQVEAALRASAREKVARIGEAYAGTGGAEGYWNDLQHEVMETALSRYLRSAVEQTRKERTGYGIWRGGDLLARLVFALIGLTIGGIIIALPFIPIFEDAFAFVLAAGSFLYPDVRRILTDWRYTRELNAIVVDAQKYQTQLASRYVSPAVLEDVLRLPEEKARPTQKLKT